MSRTAMHCCPAFADTETCVNVPRFDKPSASPPDACFSPSPDTPLYQRDAYSPAIRDSA